MESPQPSTDPVTTRQAFLVLGMHRSGTSALAGLLVRLGVEGPKTLMAPNEHNPRGFWESDAVCAFHERLLHSASSHWQSWTRVGAEWRDGAVPAPLQQELRALLEQEFGDAPLFVVKDPRICRFVPLWLHCLNEERIRPAAIIVLRNPFEVAQSLAARDHLGTEHALLLWLRHVLDAELDTRGIARSFVRYDDLLGDWTVAADKISRDVGVRWASRPTTVDIEQIGEFLDSSLRHHASAIESRELATPLSDWVGQTWTAFERLFEPTTRGMPLAFENLDRVHAELDRAALLFGSVLDQERSRNDRRAAIVERDRQALGQYAANLAEDRERLERQVSTLAAGQLELRQQSAILAAEHHELQQQHATLFGEHQKLQRHAFELEADRDRLARHTSDLEHREQELARELANTRHYIEALLGSVSWRVTSPFRLVARLFMRSLTKSY